jgi:hypothetical protein
VGISRYTRALLPLGLRDRSTNGESGIEPGKASTALVSLRFAHSYGFCLDSSLRFSEKVKKL